MALIQEREARKQQEKRLREYVEAKKPLYSALLAMGRTRNIVRQTEEKAQSVPAGEPKGSRPKAEGDAPAASARRVGLASTTATSPTGLLSEALTTRRRRSLLSRNA